MKPCKETEQLATTRSSDSLSVTLPKIENGFEREDETEAMMPDISVPAERMTQDIQTTLAHAWVIRAFLRHCEEADDYPQLSDFGRSIFDLCRAVEPFMSEPVALLKTLRKKHRAFHTAVEKFAVDAASISMHTNFQQSVESARGCDRVLQRILDEAVALGMLTAAIPRSPGPPARNDQPGQGIG